MITMTERRGDLEQAAMILDRAREFFERVNKGTRRNEKPGIYNAIAYACFLNHETKDASVYLARSLSIDPDQKEALRLRDLLPSGTDQ